MRLTSAAEEVRKKVSEIVGVVVSALVSFLIARFVHARAELVIGLERYTSMIGNGLGKNVGFSVRGAKVDNLHVLVLKIQTGRLLGVTKENVCSEYKPCLRIEGFHIVGIQTVKNDRTRFDLPLGRRGTSSLLLNINHIRHSTTAEFLVSGTLEKGRTIDEIKAELYPGLLHDVTIKPRGLISKKMNNDNFDQNLKENEFTAV